MKLAEILDKLESLGTAQNRKIYKRHGVQEPLFGVSFANLNTLKKQIKQDHTLAMLLWETGNHDARILATMIADASRLTVEQIESWLNDLDNYVISDAFSKLVSDANVSDEMAQKWRDSSKEWVGQVGWDLVSMQAVQKNKVSDSYFLKQLNTIEMEIHTSLNRVKHAMNGALIAIGIRNSVLEKEAIEVAKRIGKVVVDHGETSCKTPDAVSYITRTNSRKNAT